MRCSVICNLILIAVFSIFISACGKKESAEKTALTTAQLNTPSVEVVHPKQRSFDSETHITGNLKANQMVELYAMESGFVTSIRKDIGDHVNAGEVIATLENPELHRKLEREKANMEVKKSVYERLKSIQDKTPDLTTLEQVEVAKAEFESMDAIVKATETQLGFLQVKAPFKGTITKRYIDKGAVLQSAITQSNPQAIVEIMDLKTLRLELDVPESDLISVSVGSELTVSFPELPGQEFTATISRASGALNPKTKTMAIEVDLKNDDSRLSPGMYAKVKMQLSSKADVLSLPFAALSTHKNEYFIYKVENDIVEKMPVRMGISNTKFFEVLNSDLSVTDQVIITGKGLVSDGRKAIAIAKKD
jgi:RND family efflux transporter MFP subunit